METKHHPAHPHVAEPETSADPAAKPAHAPRTHKVGRAALDNPRTHRDLNRRQLKPGDRVTVIATVKEIVPDDREPAYETLSPEDRALRDAEPFRSLVVTFPEVGVATKDLAEVRISARGVTFLQPQV